MISEVIKHLNDINFNFEDTEMDVLGNAYEYLIGQFASNAGKKAGEFYCSESFESVNNFVYLSSLDLKKTIL